MKSRCLVRQVLDKDLTEVVEIFNHYVRESFAACPSEEVDIGFFRALLQERESAPLFVLQHEGGSLYGFGMLRPYLPLPTFEHTAQISYFIRPEHTREGLGTRLLTCLIDHARTKGIRTILANISSRNESSLQFHLKNGFSECGRLKGVGEKFGERFDVVWMQKEVG